MTLFPNLLPVLRFRDKAQAKTGSPPPPVPRKHHMTPRKLERYLDTARRIEEPKSRGDGLWICSCEYENTVTHYEGFFPFKYLQCGSCKKQLCEVYRDSTEIFTPLHPRALANLIWVGKPDLAPYFQVCTGCGLSHRAEVRGDRVEFDDMLCPCGEVSSSKWKRFHIGDAKRYRKDPFGSSAKLYMKRVEKRVEESVAISKDRSNPTQPKDKEAAQRVRKHRANQRPTRPPARRPGAPPTDSVLGNRPLRPYISFEPPPLGRYTSA
ncbi:hypothetical protein BU26DRAFT_524126 [Trematosphaeria pertusa]|uniref:Probable double zinc ribbon domain-containing protein n=1 Tax=Trematosphaeria pertusa TaxID=390896 RepID=A0A6A6HWV1_9PLEO|nr:uncharacterized protein BU26DRAFT_524126 [Trematosphaeria pertusa]KAF2242507.1 hypothetical protein BU26DRAFT_524126 [Trematosphaeria pertusa]